MSKPKHRAAVLTASDKAAAGQRQDESGPLLCEILKQNGYAITQTALLPDDAGAISAQLLRWCEEDAADVVLTTGGTGLAPRDVTPEATLAIADKQVPGIAEAIRAASLLVTPHGMLGRGVAAVCKSTLIVNLPGSPKAVRESMAVLLPALEHALNTLRGPGRDCAEPDAVPETEPSAGPAARPTAGAETGAEKGPTP